MKGEPGPCCVEVRVSGGVDGQAETRDLVQLLVRDGGNGSGVNPIGLVRPDLVERTVILQVRELCDRPTLSLTPYDPAELRPFPRPSIDHWI